MSNNSSKRAKVFGMASSMLNSVFSTLLSLFFVPFLIKGLGNNDYGVYQITAAFAANLSILNFGMSTIISRNVVRFRYKKENDKYDNTLVLGIVATVILCSTIIIAGQVLRNTLLLSIYGDKLSQNNYSLMDRMFSVLIIYIGLLVVESYFSGIIIGYERYSANYLIRVVAQCIRVGFIVYFVINGYSVFFVALSDVIMVVCHILIELIYVQTHFRIRLKWHYLDKELLKVMVSFAVASSLHSIISQVNVTLDKLIIGAYMLPDDVTIYSVALQLMTAVITITKVFSSVYLPDATKLVADNAETSKFEKLILEPGKLQGFAAFSSLFAFLVLGKELLTFWVGSDFVVMWFPTIIMLVPLSFAYSTTVADLVLDAKLKRLYRTIILFITAIINLVLTVVLVPQYGYIGAAIGTGTSYVLGNMIILNIYYLKEIKVNIFKIYFCIVKSVFPGAIISTITVFAIKRIIGDISLAHFLALVAIFIIIDTFVFAITAYSKDERSLLLHRISKRR